MTVKGMQAYLGTFEHIPTLTVGQCWVRISPGRLYATYHPTAPSGISRCLVCDRIVFRGLGRWWE